MMLLQFFLLPHQCLQASGWKGSTDAFIPITRFWTLKGGNAGWGGPRRGEKLFSDSPGGFLMLWQALLLLSQHCRCPRHKVTSQSFLPQLCPGWAWGPFPQSGELYAGRGSAPPGPILSPRRVTSLKDFPWRWWMSLQLHARSGGGGDYVYPTTHINALFSHCTASSTPRINMHFNKFYN